MKTHFSFFFYALLISMSVTVNAQTNKYHSFLKNNPVWTHIAYDTVSHDSIFYEYHLTGRDSTIKGVTYKWYNETLARILSGGFREDSIAKKIYFYNIVAEKEYLLYDFSVKMGDSYFIQLGSLKQTVTKIDSVKIGLNYRKRINGGSLYEIVEGIGCTKVNLIFQERNYYQRINSEIFCYSNSIFSTVVNSNYANKTKYKDYCAAKSLNIAEDISHNTAPPLSIYPNPCNNLLNINWQLEPIKNVRIEVLNILGEVVYSEQIPYLENTWSSDFINSLSSGIYSLILYTSDKFPVTAKFCISR